MDRQIRLLFRIFAGVGLVMLIVASYLYTSERNFVKNGVRTEGTVTGLEESRDSDGDRFFYPHISFTAVDGQTFTFRSRTGANPPAYDVGERVGVIYDPAAPQSARHAGFFSLWVGTFIGTLLAVIFGAVGFIGLTVLRRAAAKAEELRRFGRRVEAKIVSVTLNRSITVNRRHPWRVVCEGLNADTNATEQYTSGNLWIDPTGSIGQTITVFVDRQNPKRHYVDIDILKAEHAT